MLYPFKFRPIYKNYIWGGRNLQKLGKSIPNEKVAESWEISCHPEGISFISNGKFKNILLTDLIKKFGRDIIGSKLPEKYLQRFPLLIKFIDANDKLSVQVHPDDEYAMIHENGECGKNEVWYIISSKPGSKIIYGTLPGVTKEVFSAAIKDNKIEKCLKEIEVFPGDTINIPAGLIHSIGEGILLVEIQQNSNITYRVYDYDRKDKDGNKRDLHINKAIEATNFNIKTINQKVKGLEINIDNFSKKCYKVANECFSVELYDINGMIEEKANGDKFYIYIFLEGNAEIYYDKGKIKVFKGDSILIPANLGKYVFSGKFKALKTYIPDIYQDIIKPLKKAGYSEYEIYKNLGGLNFK